MTTQILDIQLQKLYDLESLLVVRVKSVETDSAKLADLASELLSCLIEQNILLGFHK